MKVVVIADVHGNFEALEALPETYQELWVSGVTMHQGLDRERTRQRQIAMAQIRGAVEI